MMLLVIQFRRSLVFRLWRGMYSVSVGCVVIVIGFSQVEGEEGSRCFLFFIGVGLEVWLSFEFCLGFLGEGFGLFRVQSNGIFVLSFCGGLLGVVFFLGFSVGRCIEFKVFVIILTVRICQNFLVFQVVVRGF